MSAAIHLIAALAFLASSFHLVAVAFILVFLACSQRSVMASERRKLGAVLSVEPDGTLRLGVQGMEVYAVPRPTSTDFGWGLWLHWEGARYPKSRRRTLRGALMLLPDGVDEEAWRELRIWFRHVAKPALGENSVAP